VLVAAAPPAAGPNGGTGCAPGAGLLVDAVQQVLELAADEIVPAPRAGGLFAARWITGLARTDGGLVPILHLDHLLGSPAVGLALARARGE
jgi:chemotaxis signal transduction protein